MMFRKDRFRKLREQNNFTHAEMAEKLHVSVRQIARYETDSPNPTSDIIVRMAEVFNVSTDYLLGLTDDPTPNLRIDNLNEKERRVLSAIRRGETLEAVKVLVTG